MVWWSLWERIVQEEAFNKWRRGDFPRMEHGEGWVRRLGERKWRYLREKKKKAQAGACSWGSSNVLGLLPSSPSSRYAREPLVLERLRELHQLGRNWVQERISQRHATRSLYKPWSSLLGVLLYPPSLFTVDTQACRHFILPGVWQKLNIFNPKSSSSSSWLPFSAPATTFLSYSITLNLSSSSLYPVSPQSVAICTVQ